MSLISIKAISPAIGTIAKTVTQDAAAKKTLLSTPTTIQNTVSPLENIPSVKKELQIQRDLKKATNPAFERFSKNFANSEPEILFVCDYVVDDKKIGCLLVWESFFDASHYEVFKKNLFKIDSTFERVLFLDFKSLEEERRNFAEYLKDTIGFDLDEDKYFVFMDPITKDDRIYEYKIRASRVPRGVSEIDFDLIIETKKLGKNIAVSEFSDSTIFDFAGTTLGSDDLAWTLSILNETVPFFGLTAFQQSLYSFLPEPSTDEEKSVLTANDINDLMSIINESVSLFNFKQTYDHVLKVLGGLAVSFRDAFAASLDETTGKFSYDQYKQEIQKFSPVYKLVLQIATSSEASLQELSKMSITVPTQTGSEALVSVENLSKVFKFVNDIYLAILYSQDKEVAKKIKELSTTVPLAIGDKPIATEDGSIKTVDSVLTAARENKESQPGASQLGLPTQFQTTVTQSSTDKSSSPLINTIGTTPTTNASRKVRVL